MRLISILVALVLMPTASGAEPQYPVDRGVWILGGGAGYQHTHLQASHSDGNEYFVAPFVGYFVIPGLAPSLSFQYQHSSNSYDVALPFGGLTTRARLTTSSIGVGPGLAYYFVRRPARFYPFVSGVGVYTRFEGSGEAFGTIQTFNQYLWAWEVSSGLDFMLCRNVAIFGALYYGRQFLSYGGSPPRPDDQQEHYGLSIGFSAFTY
jgi:hypothetical protein